MRVKCVARSPRLTESEDLFNIVCARRAFDLFQLLLAELFIRAAAAATNFSANFIRNVRDAGPRYQIYELHLCRDLGVALFKFHV
jgi:hypothetical protein